MSPKDIQSLIETGENEYLQFVASTSIHPDLIARMVCAFLNHGGGRILLGVSEDGTVEGVSDANATALLTGNQLAHLVLPYALWTAEPAHVNDADIVIVEVPEGLEKPYVAHGTIYVRHDRRPVVASRDEISALIGRRAEASQRWERKIAPGAARDDLNDKLIAETAEMAAESQRWNGDPEDIEQFLHALGLVSHSSITNAALLLFGKQPSRLLPQTRVRLLMMPDGKTGSQYSIDQTFDGCLLDVADQVPKSLASYAGGVSSTFSNESWQREDNPLYPMTALREGVMNALVHRDYASSASVTISILPDSLRISNPGGLPEGLTPADLKRDHLSLPRNPDVAHVFFIRGHIEKVGRGTQRIVQDCRRARLREPRWSSSHIQTTLTFYSHSSGKQLDELTIRQHKILGLIRENTNLLAGELIRLLGSEVTDRTLRNDLQSLVKSGWLVRRGRGRSTSYEQGPTGRSK